MASDYITQKQPLVHVNTIIKLQQEGCFRMYKVTIINIMYLLDNVKIGNLERKNRDHKVPKQDEDTGNLQILLHLRSLF